MRLASSAWLQKIVAETTIVETTTVETIVALSMRGVRSHRPDVARHVAASENGAEGTTMLFGRIGYLHHEFASVRTIKQSVDGHWRTLETLDDIHSILELPRLVPFCEASHHVLHLRIIIKREETLNLQPLAD